MSDLEKVLQRLNRRMGREASALERIAERQWRDAEDSERRLTEAQASQMRIAQAFVQDEIRKAKAGR